MHIKVLLSWMIGIKRQNFRSMLMHGDVPRGPLAVRRYLYLWVTLCLRSLLIEFSLLGYKIYKQTANQFRLLLNADVYVTLNWYINGMYILRVYDLLYSIM